MTKYELTDMFAEMWRSSRESAGKSQEYMAKSLGVSKKTIQNWESGLSCPSQEHGLEWFRVLHLRPLPFYLRILYPECYSGGGVESVSDALCNIITDLPPDTQTKLYYALCGRHGSSPIAIIEMLNAHLQSTMRDRVNVAITIYNNYEIAATSGKTYAPNEIQPNMDLLNNAIKSGRQAVLNGETEYTDRKD